MSVCTGDWNKLFAALDKLQHVEEEVDDDANKQAEMLKTAIQNYIINQEGSWQPLAPYTVEKKGHDTILIETGKLVDSVTVEKVGEADYFVHFTGWNSENQTNKLRLRMSTVHLLHHLDRLYVQCMSVKVKKLLKV